jgi:N-acetyl-anhydromuramyl-L-alanine amidase AmpD
LLIKWSGTPNYTAGRKNKKIIAIVNHITAGAFPGCLSWLQNPQSKASAHYIVARTGEIRQLVKDEDSSWHAGIVNKPNWKLYDGTNPNSVTIGIEHEGYGTNGGDGNLTEAQYQATLWLHRQLISKYKIPVDPDRIIGHYRIDSVNRPNCPGPKFPWDRLFADLKEGAIVAAFKDIVNHWAKNDIEWMMERGLVAKADSFRPNDAITRAEAAVLIKRGIEYVLKEAKK